MPASSALRRSTEIVSFLAKHRYDRIVLDEAQAPALPRADEITAAEAFVDDLERLGPTFIKFGQALSTRVDLVRPAYLKALERLQDEVAPLSPQALQAQLTVELGAPAHRVFDWFDPEPLGAASLGQVHRARLASGQMVAVKVQRPGLDASVESDLRVLERFASIADRVTRTGRRFGYRGWTDEFRR